MQGSTDHCPRMAPTPGCSFVARIPFTYGDRAFAAGDPFPYADLDMTQDAAWNFWRSAMIEVAHPTPAPEPEPVPEPRPAPLPVPETELPRRAPAPPQQRSSKR